MPSKITTYISFETRYRPPRGRDVRVFVVGTIPEMGYCKIDDPKLSVRLEKSIKRAYDEKLAGEVRRHVQGTQMRRGFGEDDSASESDEASNPEVTSEELQCALERQGPAYTRLELKQIIVECLADFAVPLEEDPDNTCELDLWASDPVKIGSVQPGEKFSYLYFVWDFDKNRLWDIERFIEARCLAIPKPNMDPKRGNAWVCRSEKLHSKKCTFREKAYYDPSSDESDYESEVEDDDDDF